MQEVTQVGDEVVYGLTAASVKFAAIAASSSGNNTIIAAVTGARIRVINYCIIAAGIVNARFESDADGTALTGQLALTANSGVAADGFPCGLFETVSGELLNLELSDAISVAGHLAYVEITP